MAINIESSLKARDNFTSFVSTSLIHIYVVCELQEKPETEMSFLNNNSGRRVGNYLIA